MKHTPGPWKADHEATRFFYCLVNSSETKSVAAIHDGENAKANAALIAAAPELLASLEALFEHCAMVHKHWGEGSNQKEADEAIKAARAALQKARS